MPFRQYLAFAVVGMVGVATPALAVKAQKGNTLLIVSTPTSGSVARAHPFINVVVRFGKSGNAAADVSTFGARLGSRDIRKLFADIVDNGGVVGKRATVPQHMLRLGRAQNRLQLTVRSLPVGKRKRRIRDVDRIKFRAIDAPNQPPVAQAATDTIVIVPRVPVSFDARGSFDPDGDVIHYHWDFGDGDSSDEPNPTKVYADGVSDVEVVLTVSDTQANGNDEISLLANCPPFPGRTPGVLRVDAPQALELGAVGMGGANSATITIRNDSTDPASQLCVRLGTQRSINETTPYTVVPSQIDDIPSGGQAQVTLNFAPTVTGHARGGLTIVASSTNRQVVHLLAHGYGGAAPGTGPTLAPEPLFSNVFGGGSFAILPSGERVAIDNSVLSCQPATGFGTRDACIVDADCNTPGEHCTPGTASLLEPVDMCGDGTGNVYLLSQDGYTDPNGDPNLAGTVLRIALDGGGHRAGADIVERITDQTYHIACDRRGGNAIYAAEYMENDDNGDCRDEWEDLDRVTPAGNSTTLLTPIDKIAGEDPCQGDLDEVGDLEVSPSGKFDAFATFQRRGGLFRIAGDTPTEIIQTVDDSFAVHPDGSILYAKAFDLGTTGTIRLYKVSPEHAQTSGPVVIDDNLTPCAVFSFPNNQGTTRFGDHPIAAVRTAPGSPDAIVVVSFRTFEGPPPVRGGLLALLNNVIPQGTIAFSSPAGDSPCTTLGLINVEQLDPITF